MIKVKDTITGDELFYEDVEDFRETSKHSFDNSLHEVIDELADAFVRGDYVGGYEQYLGIEIQEA